MSRLSLWGSAGSFDGTIRVWSATDGTHLQTLVGHAEGVTSLAVGQDSKVYSAWCDSTIRVWSGDDGTHLHTLMDYDSVPFAMAVMHDGTLVSGAWHLHTYDKIELPELLKMW
jgi:WD40 repeat protein